MKAFAVALLTGAAALSVGSARATDISTSSRYTNADLMQQVRLVCNEAGRCYRTRDRVYSSDYGPRYRYEERRQYYRDYDEPRPGIGIYGPGGVGVGIGVDPY